MESQEKQRPGFVTFWLWLGIIMSVISIPFSVMEFQNFTNLGDLGMQLIVAGVDISPFSDAIAPHVLILQAVAVISSICIIVFNAMILQWRKSGFWGILVMTVLVGMINVIMMRLIQKDYALIGLRFNWEPLLQFVVSPLSIVVLWAILHIKKNGVNCWRQLE